MQGAWTRYAASESVGGVEVERRDRWVVPGYSNLCGDLLTTSSISTTVPSRRRDTTEEVGVTNAGRDVAPSALKSEDQNLQFKYPTRLPGHEPRRSQ